MGFKYKKSELKKMISMASTDEAKSSNYSLLTNNNSPDEQYIHPENHLSGFFSKFRKSFIGGMITGLCVAQILIFSFTKIASFYQYNDTLSYFQYGQDIPNTIMDTDSVPLLHDNDDKRLADQLSKEVRVLCWVMTSPDNLQSRGPAINDTWGSRCNKLIFMSTVENKTFGAVGLDVPEGKDHLWAKTKGAFKYIYEHHLNEYDWFLRADDDTYVIVENLRKMLYAYSTEFPIYLGCKFKPIVKQGYMTGGAGYVLSREALKRFVEKALPDESKCRPGDDGEEDAELGKCLENVDVIAGDSRDESDRGRMFPFPPDHHLLGDAKETDDWYWKNIFYKTDEGPDCCSDYAVSFHGLSKEDMYEFDYCIYRLRPFGIIPPSDIMPKKKSLDEIISSLSIASNNNST